MTTFAEVVARVRSLLEVTSALVLAPTVEGWVKRAVGDLADIADRKPVLWDTLKGLQFTHEAQVSATHRLPWPDGALRVRGTGTVWGQPISRLVFDFELPAPDAYRRATRTSPWLVIRSGPSPTGGEHEFEEHPEPAGAYLEVLPHIFQKQTAQYQYIKEPAVTDEFGDALADLIVCQAAHLGAAERGDNEKLAVADKLLADKLQLLAPESK